MSTIHFDSYVSGMATGFASTATVTPRVWNGTALSTPGDGTAGAVVEDSTLGCYWCRVAYSTADLPVGSVPVVTWLVNGVPKTDPSPTLTSAVVEAGYTVLQTLALIASRLVVVTSGLPAGPWVAQSMGGSTPRVSLAFDTNGNITTSTLTPPAA
jgi:hypothetical protein